MKNKQTKTVLICGAGPVGMTLAIHLLRKGVSVRIIDKRVTPDTRSKALSLNGATMEEFKAIGISEQIISRSAKNRMIEIHHNNQIFVTIDLNKADSEFPHFTTIPQYITEDFLRNKINQSSINIERGIELTGLVQKDDHVDCLLKLQSGKTISHKFSYVIGCDGANSTVRELCEIGFKGVDYNTGILMCDSNISWKNQGKMIYSAVKNRFAIVIPMENGNHRVIVSYPQSDSQTLCGSIATIDRYLNDMGIDDLVIKEASWISNVQLYSRLSDTFQNDRIYLAGDAAHLFSPIGGQGLNTGVQDARLLSEEIYAKINGCLEGVDYANNRRAVANYVTSVTDMLTKALMMENMNSSADSNTTKLDKDKLIFWRDEFLPNFLSGKLSPEIHHNRETLK